GNVRQWFMDFAGAIPRLSRVAAADFARDGMPGDDIGIDARLAGNDDLVLFDWDAAPADWQQKDLTKAAADLGFPQLPVGAGTLAKIWRAGRDAGVPSDKFADIVRTAGYDGWQIPAIGKDNTSRRMVLVNDRAVSRVGRFAMMNAYHGTGATRQAPKDNGLRFAIAPPKGTPEWWLRKGKWQDDERLKGTKARKIVYHGSPNTFTHFDPKKKGDHTDSASAYMGYFFSDNEEVAASYSGQSGLENAIYSVGSLWNDMIRRDEMPDDLYLDKEAEKMYYNAQTASQGFLDTDVREIPGLVDALNFIINAEWTSDESKRDARSDLDYLEQIQRDGEIPMNHPVRLALKNPLIHDYGFQPWRDETFAELLAKAKKEGRDGAIFRNVQDMMIANHTATPHYSDIHIAFSPEQIISAKNGKTMKKRRKAKPKDTGGRFSVGDVFDDRDGFRQAGGDSFVGRRFAIVGESLAGEYGRRRLNRARNMRKDGASVGDIWRETGWVRGKDDKWRFEMDDVRLSDDWLRHFSRGDEQVKLSSLVENKDALELLPGARNALVSIDVLGDSTLKDGDVELVMAGVGDFGVRMVYYVGGQDVIGEWRRYVAGRVGTGPLPDRDGRQQGRKNRAGKGGVSGSDGVDNAKRSGIERERQVLAHEVQHFVQAASGLSGGVVLEPPSKYEKEYQRLGKDEVLRLLMDLRRHKSDYVLLKGAKYGRLYLQANNDAERKQALLEFLAFRHYALNLGEAEAREVQNRFGKSAEWRAANPPNWDGIAEKDLILPTGDGRYSIAPGEFRRSVGGRFDVSLRDGRAVVFDRVSNLQGGFGLRDGDALPQVVRAAKGQKVRLRAAMLRSADKIGAVLDDFSRSAAAMRGGFDIDGNIADIRKGFTGNNKRQI
ncbi:MAG: LPD23 domain-containing protein, partial [Pseudohongiellaceae bacterium]